MDAEEKDANAVLSFCLSQRPGLKNTWKNSWNTAPEYRNTPKFNSESPSTTLFQELSGDTTSARSKTNSARLEGNKAVHMVTATTSTRAKGVAMRAGAGAQVGSFYFLNVATRIFKIKYVAPIIFLQDKARQDSKCYKARRRNHYVLKRASWRY